MKKKQIHFAGILLLFIFFAYSSALPALYSGMRITIQDYAHNYYIGIDDIVGLLAANNSRQDIKVIANADGSYSLCATRRGNADGVISADYDVTLKYLVANRTAITSWEKFQIISQGSNLFSLKSCNNQKYVSADFSLSRPYLVANRTSIGSGEKFKLTIVGNDFPDIQYIDYGMPLYYWSWETRQPVTTPIFPTVSARTTSYFGIPQHLIVSLFSMPSTSTGLDNFGNVFCGEMQSHCSKYYPTIRTSKLEDLKDYFCSSGLWYTWDMGNGVFAQPDFVFVAAKGSLAGQSRIACGVPDGGDGWVIISDDWYKIKNVDGLDALTNNYGYGMHNGGNGITKWVFHHSCLALNPSDALSYRRLFRGMHAMFGYASLTGPYQSVRISTNWDCIFNGCKYLSSADVYKYFWEFMTNQKIGMWDAFCKANEKCLGEYYTKFNAKYKGSDIACVYVTGQLSLFPGITPYNYVDGSQEKIATLYNGLLPPVTVAPYWTNVNLNYKHKIYGTPLYFDPDAPL